jgi:DNA-binding NarL/FixJ family response regulator
VVGKVGTADELRRKVELARPDVVIVDIRMPPTHTDEGIVAAQELRQSHPETGVLVLSQHLESTYAMRLIEEHPGGTG